MNSRAGLIFLMGLPGAGKSTVGRQLAEKLAVPYTDLDEVIEGRTGKKINDIFSEKGEDYFRSLEAECLQNLIQTTSSGVVAVGGGTPCFFDNMEKMQAAGTTCYLKLSWQALAKRTRAADPSRPLFAGLDSTAMEESLSSRFAWRLPYYERAEVIIDIDRLLPETVVKQLLEKS